MKQLQSIVRSIVFIIGVSTMINCYSQSRTKFSLETDPSTFLLSGYSLHARIQPANCERWLIGAGTYGLRLPSMLVNINPDNRDEGWNTKIRNAVAMYGEYYFRGANQKWFIGEQAGVQNYHLANDYEGGNASRFSTMLLMTYAGYSWHPFHSSLYVKPWAGLGYTRKISGSTVVGSQVYDVAPLFPFVTFHIGYEF